MGNEISEVMKRELELCQSLDDQLKEIDPRLGATIDWEGLEDIDVTARTDDGEVTKLFTIMFGDPKDLRLDVKAVTYKSEGVKDIFLPAVELAYSMIWQ